MWNDGLFAAASSRFVAKAAPEPRHHGRHTLAMLGLQRDAAGLKAYADCVRRRLRAAERT